MFPATVALQEQENPALKEGYAHIAIFQPFPMSGPPTQTGFQTFLAFFRLFFFFFRLLPREPPLDSHLPSIKHGGFFFPLR